MYRVVEIYKKKTKKKKHYKDMEVCHACVGRHTMCDKDRKNK